jgi:hypothetical protein
VSRCRRYAVCSRSCPISVFDGGVGGISVLSLLGLGDIEEATTSTAAFWRNVLVLICLSRRLLEQMTRCIGARRVNRVYTSESTPGSRRRRATQLGRGTEQTRSRREEARRTKVGRSAAGRVCSRGAFARVSRCSEAVGTRGDHQDSLMPRRPADSQQEAAVGRRLSFSERPRGGHEDVSPPGPRLSCAHYATPSPRVSRLCGAVGP